MLHLSIGTACVEFGDKDSDEQALNVKNCYVRCGGMLPSGRLMETRPEEPRVNHSPQRSST